jgi:hypothetical protein
VPGEAWLGGARRGLAGQGTARRGKGSFYKERKMAKNNVTVTIYIPVKVKEWLEAKAKQEGRTLSNMATRLFQELQKQESSNR